MFAKIISWLKEICPYCDRKLVVRDGGHFHAKVCPEGHYKIETHPALEVQIEYHLKNR